jgi:hypothetical protein
MLFLIIQLLLFYITIIITATVIIKYYLNKEVLKYKIWVTKKILKQTKKISLYIIQRIKKIFIINFEKR